MISLLKSQTGDLKVSTEPSIRILVDDVATPLGEILETTQSRGVAPSNSKSRSINLPTRTLANAVGKLLTSVYTILSQTPLDTEQFEVTEVAFTLTVDAEGEVSLVSLAKGTLSEQSGLSFRIIRKRPDA
jgi:hypothetical protein